MLHVQQELGKQVGVPTAAPGAGPGTPNEKFGAMEPVFCIVMSAGDFEVEPNLVTSLNVFG